MADPGAIELSPLSLAAAATLLVVPAAISIGLKLGLERKIAWAGTRTVAQLAFIGLILEWVFRLDRWYYVVEYVGRHPDEPCRVHLGIPVTMSGLVLEVAMAEPEPGL